MLGFLVVVGFITLWLLLPRVAFVVALALLAPHLGWAHPSFNAAFTTDRIIVMAAVLFGVAGFALDVIERINFFRRSKESPK